MNDESHENPGTPGTKLIVFRNNLKMLCYPICNWLYMQFAPDLYAELVGNSYMRFVTHLHVEFVKYDHVEFVTHLQNLSLIPTRSS